MMEYFPSFVVDHHWSTSSLGVVLSISTATIRVRWSISSCREDKRRLRHDYGSKSYSVQIDVGNHANLLPGVQVGARSIETLRYVHMYIYLYIHISSVKHCSTLVLSRLIDSLPTLVYQRIKHIKRVMCYMLGYINLTKLYPTTFTEVRRFHQLNAAKDATKALKVGDSEFLRS